MCVSLENTARADVYALGQFAEGLPEESALKPFLTLIVDTLLSGTPICMGHADPAVLAALAGQQPAATERPDLRVVPDPEPDPTPGLGLYM